MMKSPIRFESYGAIEITNPGPPGSTGEPQPYPIDEQCRINANGVCSAPVREICGVSGRVGEVGDFTEGRFYFLEFSLTGVPGAVPGIINTLTIKLMLKTETSPTYAVEVEVFRDFLGTGGGPSCGSGSSGTGGVFANLETGQPLNVAMPRYLRVRVVLGGAGVSQPSRGIFGSGLLQATSIYLAYDSTHSRPTEAVFHNINLPSEIGNWTLRIRRKCEKFHAQLVFQRLTVSEVLMPVTFESTNWTFKGENAFRCDGHRAKSLDLPDGQSAVILVDPA